MEKRNKVRGEKPRTDRNKNEERRPRISGGKSDERKPRAPKRTENRAPRTEARVGAVPTELPEDVVVGRNAITELLKSGRGVNKLLIAEGDHLGSVREIIALAKERGVVTETVARGKIEGIAAGYRHQGVLAYASPVPYAELEDILAKVKDKEAPFLILLDELEDPHNLGAILRTADAAGVDGVLIPKRRGCPLSATVAKTSAGAVEYIPVARIGNVVQTLKQLKEAGFWVAAADMDATAYDETDLTGPLVLVIGGEGHGVARLTRENCDFILSLPMVGHINSLNASVAGAILMYEVLRQRRNKTGKA